MMCVNNVMAGGRMRVSIFTQTHSVYFVAQWQQGNPPGSKPRRVQLQRLACEFIVSADVRAISFLCCVGFFHFNESCCAG